jgi:hypothetical protein
MMLVIQGYNILKNRYEGAGGQFASEASRIMDVSAGAGDKRKMPEGGHASTHESKAPLGMWDAFGDDISKYGYSNVKDAFMEQQIAGPGGGNAGAIPSPFSGSRM